MEQIEQSDTSKRLFDIDIDLPEGLLIVEDENILKEYATGKDLVVELGTYKGRGACILSFFAKRVYTVDEFSKNKPVRFEDVKKDLERFENIIEVMCKMSDDSARYFSDNSIDLLVQDAGHSAENVVNDVVSYLPKLKDNAIILIHDYKYMNGRYEDRNVQGGVKILLEKNIIEKVDIKGWYFIGRKK